MNAHWLNSGLDGQLQGYACTLHHFESAPFLLRWLLREKPIYEFQLDATHPLTLVDEVGNQWQPDRHRFTDKGSIPVILHWMIDPDETVAFYTHDCSYDIHGLYFRPATPAEAMKWDWYPQTLAECQWIAGADVPESEVGFHLIRLTKVQADRLLHDGYLAQHGNSFAANSKANKILAGVSMGGIFAWMRGAWKEQNSDTVHD